jgi:hypothetical protein
MSSTIYDLSQEHKPLEIPAVRQLTEAEIAAYALRNMAKSLNAQADILEQTYGVKQKDVCQTAFAFDPKKRTKR